MDIPGIAAKHLIIRDGCRELHGDNGAIAEAIRQLEAEPRLILAGWPEGHGVEFHLVMTVDRTEYDKRRGKVL
jgi:hypothetical protein